MSRDPKCVEAWPQCIDGGYDPRCCRFPKSCSCGSVMLYDGSDESPTLEAIIDRSMSPRVRLLAFVALLLDDWEQDEDRIYGEWGTGGDYTEFQAEIAARRAEWAAIVADIFEQGST